MSEQFMKLGEDLEVGLVPLDKIVQRRKNYRKMSKEQLQALRTSIRRYGFKTLIAVERLNDGTYGIIDGHHRVQVLRENGAALAPVVIVAAGSKAELDLAMVTFNITGEVLPTEFYDLVKELEISLGLEEVAEATAISVDFLKELRAAEEAANTEAQDIPDVVSEGKGKSKKQKNRLLQIWGVNGAYVVEVAADFVPDIAVHQAAEDKGMKLGPASPDLIETNEQLLEYIEGL